MSDQILKNSLTAYSQRFSFPTMRIILNFFGQKNSKEIVVKHLFENHQPDYSKVKNLNHVYYSIRAAFAVLLQLEKIPKSLNLLLNILWISRINSNLFYHPVLQRAAIRKGQKAGPSFWSRELIKKWGEEWELVELEHKHETNFKKLENVYLYSSGITLDIAKRKVYSLSPSDDPRLPFVAGQWADIMSFEGEKKAWVRKDLLTNPTQSTNTPLIDIRARCAYNYWHALLDGGTKLIKSRDYDSGENKFLASYETPATVKLAYEVLSNKKEIIYVRENQKFYSKEVIIPPKIIEVFDNCVGYPPDNCTFDVTSLYELSNELITKLEIQPSPYKKILIVRNGNWRNVKGQDILASKLGKLGFHVVSPEQHSLQEQISIFRGAQVIVGASGAAWANLIFCQEKTSVLSLCSDLMAPWDMHKRIATNLGLSYFQCIMKSRLDRDSYNAVNYRNAIHGNFEINVNQTLESLHNLIPDMNL